MLLKLTPETHRLLDNFCSKKFNICLYKNNLYFLEVSGIYRKHVYLCTIQFIILNHFLFIYLNQIICKLKSDEMCCCRFQLAHNTYKSLTLVVLYKNVWSNGIWNLPCRKLQTYNWIDATVITVNCFWSVYSSQVSQLYKLIIFFIVLIIYKL